MPNYGMLTDKMEEKKLTPINLRLNRHVGLLIDKLQNPPM